MLTWPQMKRVYGLRDNTTEHSEYKRLAEQLMRPEWEQLRREWKWAVTEQSAHGQKTGWRTPDRVLKVKAALLPLGSLLFASSIATLDLSEWLPNRTQQVGRMAKGPSYMFF